MLESVTSSVLQFVSLRPRGSSLRIIVTDSRKRLLKVSRGLAGVPRKLRPGNHVTVNGTRRPRLTVLSQTQFSLPRSVDVVENPDDFDSFDCKSSGDVVNYRNKLCPRRIIMKFSMLEQSIGHTPIVIGYSKRKEPNRTDALGVRVCGPGPLILRSLGVAMPRLTTLRSNRTLRTVVRPGGARLVRIPVLG